MLMWGAWRVPKSGGAKGKGHFDVTSLHFGSLMSGIFSAAFPMLDKAKLQ